jgi:hypothetical protein
MIRVGGINTSFSVMDKTIRQINKEREELTILYGN